MAKQANELLNRKVLQNLRTSGSNEYIVNKPLQDNVALGEIIVQMGSGATVDAAKKTTGLWTLAADGSTPVRFPSEERVSEMISSGAVAEVDAIETAVGLNSDGTYIAKSDTNYLNSATTVEGEIDALDDALGALSGVVDSMDTESVANDNKVVSDVTQTDGKITATTKNITAVKLDGYTVGGDDSDKVASTDTLGEALGKLQGQINGMDKDASAVNGQVVTTVSETDGKVSETKANVKDLQLGGYAKDTTATGDITGTDTINAALSKLENTIGANKVSNADGSINVTEPSGTATTTDINVNIKEGEHVIKNDVNGDGLYTDIDLVKITTGLPANVKERYQLLASDDTQLGADIDIYKDSSLHSVYLGHIDDSLADNTSPVVTPGSGDTALCFIYNKADGTYELVAINVESFLEESEFKDGLSVLNHEVKVKIDDTSEKDSQSTPVSFLTVGPNGVKLDGIKAEITRKIEALDYTDSAATGEYVTEVNEANGVISVKRANVSEAPLNNYEKGEDATSVVATDTINQAVSKLENQTDTLARATESELSSIKDDIDAFKHKLTLSGKENNYAKVTVTSADSGTTIEVSAKTKTISESTALEQGIADSYDVRTFAVNNIVADTTRISIIENTATGNTEGVRKIDFSLLSIDCGEF